LPPLTSIIDVFEDQLRMAASVRNHSRIKGRLGGKVGGKRGLKV